MGAWIEIPDHSPHPAGLLVAPAWGRGLKSVALESHTLSDSVAPAWGRGLKLLETVDCCLVDGRPRMGAWIEILGALFLCIHIKSPPHGGVD